MARTIVLGLLRRDLDFVGAFDDEAEARQVAEQSVRQQRYGRTFLVAALADFSESDLNFTNPDARVPLARTSSNAPYQLNPGRGEQPQPDLDSTDLEEINPRVEAYLSTENVGGEPVKITPAEFDVHTISPEGAGSPHPSVESQGATIPADRKAGATPSLLNVPPAPKPDDAKPAARTAPAAPPSGSGESNQKTDSAKKS